MPASTSQRRTKPKVRRNSDVIIAFWKFGDAWAHDYDASHAGVVVEVNGRNVIIIDAAYGDIGIRSAYNGANYAHPYYDE